MFTLTLKEMGKLHKDMAEKVFTHAGSTSHLAVMLSTYHATVAEWERQGRISIKGAVMIDDNPGLPFTKEELRPEVNFDELL